MAHLLPAQGPISVFIHHNTLHAFEHLPFEQAVVEAGRILGCEPFLSEDRYREELARGRISARDVSAVLEDELGARASDAVAGITSRLALRRRIALHGIPAARGVALGWLLSESSALERFRHDLPGDAREVISSVGTAPGDEEAASVRALWQACGRVIDRAPPPPTPPAQRRVRHRDLVLAHADVDTDDWVHPVLIRFASAYLDQGLAQRPMSGRGRGMYQCFLDVYGSRLARLCGAWARKLPDLIAHERQRGFDGHASLEHSLADLGVAEDEYPDYLADTALALRGFAGMVHEIETRPDRVPANPVPARLADFLAVRLLLERAALGHAAEAHLGYRGPLAELCAWCSARGTDAPAPRPDTDTERAWQIFHVAQLIGSSEAGLDELGPDDIADLERELFEFDDIGRRRVLHLAYERHLCRRYYDALAQHPAHEPAHAPGFQAVFCIDEREESFRRHLEEIEPDVETASTAGFFGIAMYYRGATDARPRPLCPVVIRPEHYVGEADRAAGSIEAALQRWQRRGGGLVGEGLHRGSRTLFGGAVLTALFGVLAVIPLVMRVLVPWLGKRLVRPQRAPAGARTELELARTEAPPPMGRYAGFTVEEMSGVVARLLEDTGLAGRTAPLVFIIGHGSSSLNNPHKSAYDCGACGGGPGGPNARAFAQMANDPRVRASLAERGLTIPDSTWFVGAQRNTASNAVDLFDVERVPDSHATALERARAAFDRARALEAHERCRRFEQAPGWLPARAALMHVEARSADLAQPRPECGHATNAFCVVGRRSRTRGLFLDRRVFLVSYDPDRDPDLRILARTLAAVVPVVAGINLEYYFSYVDPAGYGCGTKLPHNVTSLLGVMDGPESDLRTGLPWQMVEIHEPVRLSVIIECAPEAVMHVLDQAPALARLFDNRWLHLACLDPGSNQIWERRGDTWLAYQPEHAPARVTGDSAVWYRGHRGHLAPARIEHRREAEA